MLMPTSHYLRLVEICSRPGVTWRTQMIAIRRMCRHITESQHHLEGAIRRNIRSAKRRLPFAANALEENKALLRKFRANGRQALSAFGSWLRNNRETLEAHLGWDGLCDILCVNPVHRGDIKRPERGLFAITWVGGWYEDSATHWGKWHQTGAGPITRAIEVCMQEWMLQNMDKLPDPFAPGGPLYGVPAYHKHPDGSMVRATPALTVIANGRSKVIASRPGRHRSIQSGEAASVVRLKSENEVSYDPSNA